MRSIDAAESSRGLLSAILLDPRTIPLVESIVVPEDFDDADHRRLFNLLVEMNRAGESVRDTRLVMNRLRASGVLDALGGPDRFKLDYLNDRASENAATYARQVRGFAVNKQVAELSIDFAKRTERNDIDADSVLSWLRAELGGIESKASDQSHVSTIGEACAGLMQDIDATVSSGQSAGLPTGITQFDDVYGGLYRSRLYVPAAGPGRGKSSLAQQIGENIAASNRGAFYVSLEMSRAELAGRYLARQTRINAKYILSHAITPSDQRCLTKATEKSQGVPFLISEPFGRQATVEAICSSARVRKATDDISVVIIDYLQIIEPSTPKQTEYEKVTLATRAFKQLSRELAIPVVLLSQLNRRPESDGKEPRRPRLSDLRSSGSIEQDADAVLFLHDEGGGLVRLIVAKMRGAEKSDAILLRFDGPLCEFQNPAIEDDPNFNDAFAEYAHWETAR